MRPSVRAAAVVVASGVLLATGLPRAAAQDRPPDTPPDPPAFEPPPILAQRRAGPNELRVKMAVATGLDWLRRHHGKDGRWDADGFAALPCKCDGPGVSTFDPGVTALAVLAFLGAGRTHTEGPDAELVRSAIRYLVAVQDSEGCFGPRTDKRFQYNHATATMAVAEALWLTGDERLLAPVAKARDFVLASRNPYLAWRYGVRDGDNDSSLTAYAVLALRTCQFARLDVSDETYAGAYAWWMKMTLGETGRVGYQGRGGNDARAWIEESKRPPPPPVSVGGFRYQPQPDRVHTAPARDDGLGRESFDLPGDVLQRYPQTRWSSLTAAAAAGAALTRGADAAECVDFWSARIAERPPTLKDGGFLDLHYLLFGSLFHAQRPSGGRVLVRWRGAAVSDLLAAQQKKDAGCAAGSWDPDQDPFGAVGGRVYSTAMALLALQAPDRFPVVWDPKRRPPEPAKPPAGK